VDLLTAYSNRPDIADDLAILRHKLEQASRDEQPIGRQSVQREQPPSERRVGNRLTHEDIGRLIAAFVSGTPKRQLAEQYGISESSVKRLLRRHDIRKPSG
jgi:DNA invertase Pin-like site-specific DNA recombinase